jgi:hypothetical protein
VKKASAAFAGLNLPSAIRFVYKSCTESYGDSYADSYTCRRPLNELVLRLNGPFIDQKNDFLIDEHVLIVTG